MNIELLERVKAHILEEPLRCNMEHGLVASSVSPCNTVGCIAGWATAISDADQLEQILKDAATYLEENRTNVEDGDSYDESHHQLISWWGSSKQPGVSVTAATLLELSAIEAKRLFMLPNMNASHGWPEEFVKKLRYKTPGTPEYAAVVAARIDHFIVTNGEE